MDNNDDANRPHPNRVRREELTQIFLRLHHHSLLDVVDVSPEWRHIVFTNPELLHRYEWALLQYQHFSEFFDYDLELTPAHWTVQLRRCALIPLLAYAMCLGALFYGYRTFNVVTHVLGLLEFFILMFYVIMYGLQPSQFE